MNEKKWQKVLECFEVPEASAQAKQRCIDRIRECGMFPKREPKFYMLSLLRIQFSYIQKERLLYIFAVVLLSACAFSLFLIEGDPSDILKGNCNLCLFVVPFYVLPLILSLYRSSAAKMEELECSCRYHLRELVTAKLLVNGILAATAIAVLWIVMGVRNDTFCLPLLLWPLIHYNSLLICCLGFGRKKIINGLAAGFAWTLLESWYMQREKSFRLIYGMNIILTLSLFMITCAIVAYIFYRYVSRITFEKEDAKWSFMQID